MRCGSTGEIKELNSGDLYDEDIFPKVLKSSGRESNVALGSVGIPLAIGAEIGQLKNVLTWNVELGFALYAGPAADDFELVIKDQSGSYSTTISGSSGLLAGLGLNYYF